MATSIPGLFDFLDKAIIMSQWSEWFAWHPVKDIDGKWHCFSKVYRRKFVFRQEGVHTDPHYEYGTLFHVLKDNDAKMVN